MGRLDPNPTSLGACETLIALRHRRGGIEPVPSALVSGAACVCWSLGGIFPFLLGATLQDQC